MSITITAPPLRVEEVDGSPSVIPVNKLRFTNGSLTLNADGSVTVALGNIASYTADTSPTADDLILTLNDPGGTPTNKKVALSNAITKAHGLTGTSFILTLDASDVIQASNSLDVSEINLPSSDANPGTTAGQIRHDTTITGVTGGAVKWYDGSAVRGLFDAQYAPTNLLGSFSSPITTNPYTYPLASAYGTALFYGATGEIDLPVGASGMNLVIYNTGAFTITVDPNGTEIIVRDGTAQAAGVSFTLSSGAGNYVSMINDGSKWITLGFKGVLTQGS